LGGIDFNFNGWGQKQAHRHNAKVAELVTQASGAQRINSNDHAVTWKSLEILRAETDADGQKLKIAVIESPRRIRPQFESDDFAAGHINFYLVNGAVIMPEFGGAIADNKAKLTLQDLFADRDIV
jgi:agmatine deiminase